MLAQVNPSMPAGNSTTLWIAAAIVVLLIVLLFAVIGRRRRSQAFRERYGPEYERTVAETGSTQRAEADLERREKRYRKLDIRPLHPVARERYAAAWRTVQTRFVDDPRGAVRDADALVEDVMRERGYPVDDTAHRMEDLSVEHGRVLDTYREATAIAQRSARGEADTEDLRRATVSYRTLFADLLGADPVAGDGTVEGRIVEPRSTTSTKEIRR